MIVELYEPLSLRTIRRKRTTRPIPKAIRKERRKEGIWFSPEIVLFLNLTLPDESINEALAGKWGGMALDFFPGGLQSICMTICMTNCMTNCMTRMTTCMKARHLVFLALVVFPPPGLSGKDIPGEPEVAGQFHKVCQGCHTVPDPRQELDRAWLDQVHRTA